MTGIYKIENLVNGKVYIGQARDIKSRWRSHISDLKYNRHGNTHLQRAYNKYEKEHFKFEVIEECNIDELDIKEQYWINYYGGSNSDNVYNSTDGGQFVGKKLNNEAKQNISNGRKGIKFSELHRKRLSEAHKGKKLSIEHIEKIRLSNSKVNHSYKHTEEAKQKMREAKLGKTTSNKQKETVREMMNKRWTTDEYREKMRNIGKSCPHPSGRKHTPEEIEKIRLAGLGRIFTEETKRKIGEANKGGKTAHPGNDYVKGRIWINNGVITKMIYPNELEKYLQSNFKLGRLKRG